MSQDEPLLVRALALEMDCAYCGYPLESEGPKKPTRDHVKSRASGGQLRGHGRAIVCFQCNQDKAADSLVAFLLRLIRQKDDRAGYVVDYALSLYEALPAHEVDAIVGMPTPPPPKPKKYVASLDALPPPGRRCIFPRCACSKTCERHGRPSAKEAPG